MIANRYTVTGQIGAGGGGTVWRATDEVLGRTVAIKEIALPAHLPEPDRLRVRTRALREARAAARLEHRSVITIYDVIEGDEALHIVMEHVDAPSLATLVSHDGPLPPQRVAAIGLEVLDGLEAAHRGEVIHRDVKPSNVLVPDVGPAVVTDFGVAAVLGETGLTRTGEALGTPDYISPEQLEGGPVGPPCDLWALGSTLYDAVEGVPPFQRDNMMATINAVASAAPRPMERAGPLATVLMGLLAKDPAARPDTAATRDLLRTAHESASRQDEDGTPSTVVISTGVATRDAAEPPQERGPDGARSGPDRPVSAGTEDGGERRRAMLILGSLLALALVAVVIGLTSGDGDTTTDGSDPNAQASVAAPEPPQASAEPSQSPSSATPPPTEREPAAPEPEPAAPESEPSPTESQPAAPEPEPSPAEPEPTSSEPEPEPAPATTEPEAPSAPASSGALPDGWRSFDGGAFSVGVPGDWEPREAPDSATDLVAPSGDAYLRAVDTDAPAADVLLDTQRIRDDFRSRYGSYQQIALEPVQYRDYDAVRWEYTYTPGDQTLRAVHLNFSNGDHGFILNYQVPAARWDDLSGRFDDFTATFQER